MNFDWTDEEREYRDAVIRFAQDELNDDIVARDAHQEFPSEAWKRCAEFGIHGLPVPGCYGGQGAEPLRIAMAMEALGYGCRDNGLIFSINAHMWSCQIPILQFGTEDQKRRYLPSLCNGSLIGVQGMTEPDSGSDAFALSTKAEQLEDHFILNGSKTFITNGPIADLFVVFAATQPQRGFAGISAFLVERNASGLSVGEPLAKMGLRTAPMSELHFSNLAVPADQMLGVPGGGMAVFNTSMDWERSFILASAVGTMQRQVERCIQRARTREQFGQAIGKFQSVSNKVVDMKVRLETARLLLYQLAWLRGRGKTTNMESATAKLYISECFVQSSLDALQLHGGYGYLTDQELERDVRDAVASRIYSGTSEMQRRIVARRLGL